MLTDTLRFLPFGPEHIEGGLRLSQAAKWPHRAQDWALLQSLSHGIVAMNGKNIVATALATPFGPVATLNMIIVDQAMRGRGLAKRSMQQLMLSLSPQQWRLVATQDGLPLYEKLGFVACGTVLQHQGIAQTLSADASQPSKGALESAGPDDFTALAAIDTAATGMHRQSLIAALLRQGKIFVIREQGQIAAYAALRAFGRGELAGPVIARTLPEAQHLLSHILGLCAGRFLRMDTTSDTHLAPWLQQHGLLQAGGGVAMRLGSAPQPTTVPQSHTTFALAAQALG